MIHSHGDLEIQFWSHGWLSSVRPPFSDHLKSPLWVLDCAAPAIIKAAIMHKQIELKTFPIMDRVLVLYLNPVLKASKLVRWLSFAVAVDDRLRKAVGYSRIIKQHTIWDNSHVGTNRRVLLERLKNCIYKREREREREIVTCSIIIILLPNSPAENINSGICFSSNKVKSSSQPDLDENKISTALISLLMLCSW